jgi:hypothetical protein
MRGFQMTDFAVELRHRCRNPHCRSKLPEPVSNERDAFCCRGCYESFYLHRCRVCEKSLEAKYRTVKPKKDGGHIRYVKVENSSPTCGSTDCKRRWRQKDNTGRFSAPKQPSGYQGSQESNLHKETPAAQALFSAIKRPRWRQIAGSPLTPNQFHCATVPDGEIVDGVPTWQDGKYERIEASNRRLLEAHFDELDSAAVDHCTVCGRDDDLVDYRGADGWVTTCRDCRANRAADVAEIRRSDWRPVSTSALND